MNGSVDEFVRGFARFISASWEEISRAAAVLELQDAADLIADWRQANWEVFVESTFRDSRLDDLYLEPYGEGAKCNGSSSRVWKPDAVPTHRVVCAPIGEAIVDLLGGWEVDPSKGRIVFDKLASLSNAGCHE